MKKTLIIGLLAIVFIIGALFISFQFSEDSPLKIGKKKKTYEVYEKGDVVDFYDDSWFVLYDSDKTEEYVTLISSKISYFEEAPTVIQGIYETSDINKYFKDVLTKEYGEDNLVEKNGYSVRLFDQDDMRQLLDVKYNEKDDSYTIIDCPNYICLNHTSFATMIDSDINYEATDVYNNVSDIGDEEYYQLHVPYYHIVGVDNEYSLDSIVDNTAMFVRPVINVHKESLIETDPYHYENFGE